MKSATRCVACLGVATILNVAAQAEPPKTNELRRGSAFVRELDKPLGVNRDRVELRELLDRLSEERKLAIVLDRRVDPSCRINVKTPPLRVQEAIESIARQAGATTRIVGNTIVVGPESGIGSLRTVCLLRGLEVDDLGAAAKGRRFELSRTITLAWEDLDRPSDLVSRIAEQAHLRVMDMELIPHDLWARGCIVEMTPIEALSWILGQYDLTFEWIDAAEGVRIVPITGAVTVTKEHPVRGIQPDEALRRVTERYPDVAARLDGKKIIATGLIEQQDAISKIARGENPDAKPKPLKFDSLAKQRLTLRVANTSAASVLQKLQESGIDIQIDQNALQTANVNLNGEIKFDLKDATIAAVMRAICEPVGATFSVDGETVHVPAKK
ncbi:MAG: hypothetical protein U0992_23935 [Planctomycetaceae bacterium]